MQEETMETLESLIVKQSHKDGEDIDAEGLEVQLSLYEAEKYKSENERYKDDTRSRKILAIWAATIVSTYLAAVLVFLFGNQKWNIGLSDTVLVALLGTTTLNVLGLMYIVLKGLFAVKNLEFLQKSKEAEEEE